MAMAEQVGHGLQRMAFLEHSGGEAMPEDMGAFAGKLDACRLDATLYDGRKGVGIRQGMIGRSAGQKNVGVGTSGTGIL